MEPTNTMPEAPKEKSNGALIGSIIIIIILILGGIYLLSQNATEEPAPQDTLSQSDDLESIEADLEGQIEFENLDQGLE